VGRREDASGIFTYINPHTSNPINTRHNARVVLNTTPTLYSKRLEYNARVVDEYNDHVVLIYWNPLQPLEEGQDLMKSATHLKAFDCHPRADRGSFSIDTTCK
jgi:hypothetical protein